MRTTLQTGLILLLSCTCLAQVTAPTVEETGKFIVSKLDNTVTGGAYTVSDSPSYGGTVYWTTSISIVECSVHLKMLQKDTRVDPHTGEKEVQEMVRLESRINARDLVVSSSEVQEVQRENLIFANPYWITYFPIAGRSNEFFTFYMSDKSVAIRLQKAFISLGHSCGAKDEPF